MDSLKWAGIGHDGHFCCSLTGTLGDQLGTIRGVVRLPKRCDITDPGPVIVSPTAEMCVYIFESFLCCVRLAGPTFGVRIVGNKQYGQGYMFDVWTICLFGLDALRIQLGDPVAVKEAETLGTLSVAIVGFHVVESWVWMPGTEWS